MKKLVIFGDSFSDPTWAKNDFYKAWPELLADDYEITNKSLSGSSMWWSYKQFKEIQNDYDKCIFVVTIPGRIHIESLDRHLNFNETTWPRWFGINFGEMWFKYFYSQEREECFHNFMLKDIMESPNTLVIPAFVESIPGYDKWTLCHFADMEIYHYGMSHAGNNEKRKCHLTKENNLVIYNRIKSAFSNGDKVLPLCKEDYVVPADPMHKYWF
jgi:hypothetical protein